MLSPLKAAAKWWNCIAAIILRADWPNWGSSWGLWFRSSEARRWAGRF